jgi:energy-converting hydrogenase Eha subunit A
MMKLITKKKPFLVANAFFCKFIVFIYLCLPIIGRNIGNWCRDNFILSIIFPFPMMDGIAATKIMWYLVGEPTGTEPFHPMFGWRAQEWSGPLKQIFTQDSGRLDPQNRADRAVPL